MTNRTTGIVSALTMCVFALAHPTSSLGSDTILPGWDLLQTDPNLTTFFGAHFEGVPLGTFDFDSTIGVKNVGQTDTVIHRVSTASVPGPGNSDTIFTGVDAFQLRSVDPVSIMGGAPHIYYITLASLRGGPVSTGTMTIDFGPEGDPHGTFSSSFQLYVDVRQDTFNGPIVDSRLINILDSGSVPWRHEANGAIQIPGVNIDLNGSNSDNDFWLEGSVFKNTPNGRIVAHNTGVPDSGNTLLLLVGSLAGIVWIRGRDSTPAPMLVGNPS